MLAASGKTICAGTAFGLFYSEDGSKSWEQANLEAENPFVQCLAVSDTDLYPASPVVAFTGRRCQDSPDSS